MAHTVAAQYRQAIGHRVATMRQHPCIALAVFFILRIGRVPANRGGIQQQLGTGQRHHARRFRVPLVPAHQYAEFAHRGLNGGKTQITGGEIEFFVEARIVRDVHLAVLAGQRAVGVKHHGGVVVQPRRALFEQGRDQHHAMLLGQRRQARGAGAGDGLGQIELVYRFVLAKIRTVVQLLQQYELRAGASGFSHAGFDDGQVGGGIAVVALLDQRNGEKFGCHPPIVGERRLASSPMSCFRLC